MFERIVSIIPFELASPLVFIAGFILILAAVFFPAPRRRGLYFPLGFWRSKISLRSRSVWIFSALISAIIFLLAIGLAGPIRLEARNSSFNYNKPVMVVVDVSGSMDTNYKKSLQVFQEILRQDLQASIGVELYSGDAYIARDFAPDVSFLRDTVENEKEIRQISADTSTAKALALARFRFSKEEERLNQKFIILVSDLVDDLPQVAKEMRADIKSGITLFAIVVAEDSEAAVRIATLRGLLSPADPQFVAAGDQEGIDDIFSQIKNAEGSFLVRSEDQEETSMLHWILAPLLGLLLVSVVLSETIFKKVP